MKRNLILCLIVIWWHPKCSSCKPIEFKVDYAGPPHTEAFKVSREPAEMEHPPKTNSKLNGVSPVDEHPFSKEPHDHTPLLESLSTYQEVKPPEPKSNGFHHQTSEDRSAGPESLGSPDKSDNVAENPVKPVKVPPESLDGPEKASENLSVNKPQPEKMSVTPEVTQEPEKVNSGTTTPWHRRIWQRVHHWIYTSPSLAARTTKFLVRWLSFDKPKRKTAEEKKQEKEAEELAKYIQLHHKALEVDPTFVIDQKTKTTAENPNAIAQDSDVIANEPHGIAEELKGSKKEPNGILKQPIQISKEPKGIGQDPNEFSKKEVDKEYEKIRSIVYQVLLEIMYPQEHKVAYEKEDQESQKLMQLLQKVNPLPGNSHEIKAA